MAWQLEASKLKDEMKNLKNSELENAQGHHTRRALTPFSRFFVLFLHDL